MTNEKTYLHYDWRDVYGIMPAERIKEYDI